MSIRLIKLCFKTNLDNKIPKFKTNYFIQAYTRTQFFNEGIQFLTFLGIISNLSMNIEYYTQKGQYLTLLGRHNF